MLGASIEQLNAILGANEFTRRYGFQVTAAVEGACEMSVPYLPEHDRPGGIVSGQVAMHAADVAFWLALKTRLGTEEEWVTSGMTTAFLSPARQEPFTCRAQVLKVGGRLVYGTAECAAGERLLTHHTLTYARATSRAAATTSS